MGMKKVGIAFDKSSVRTFDADGRMHSKTCSACNCKKSTEAFSKRSKSIDGLQGKCKECAARCKKAWLTKNVDHVKAYAKTASVDYRSRNRVEILAKKQDYYLKNRDRVIEKTLQWQIDNREKVNLKNSIWAKANPLGGYEKRARRVAAKKNALAAWADPIKVRDIYRTAKSISIESGVLHDVDHIVPLQSDLVCGLHCEANLQVLSRRENASKGNKHWPDMPI